MRLRYAAGNAVGERVFPSEDLLVAFEFAGGKSGLYEFVAGLSAAELEAASEFALWWGLAVASCYACEVGSKVDAVLEVDEAYVGLYDYP